MKRFIVPTIAAMLMAGGVAYASIPGSDGKVHACYTTGGPYAGLTRIIDANAGSCHASESEVALPASGPLFAVINKIGADPAIIASSDGVSISSTSCSGGGAAAQCTLQVDMGPSLANCGLAGSFPQDATAATFQTYVNGSGLAVFRVSAPYEQFDPVRLMAAC